MLLLLTSSTADFWSPDAEKVRVVKAEYQNLMPITSYTNNNREQTFTAARSILLGLKK